MARSEEEKNQMLATMMEQALKGNTGPANAIRNVLESEEEDEKKSED